MPDPSTPTPADSAVEVNDEKATAPTGASAEGPPAPADAAPERPASDDDPLEAPAETATIQSPSHAEPPLAPAGAGPAKPVEATADVARDRPEAVSAPLADASAVSGGEPPAAHPAAGPPPDGASDSPSAADAISTHQDRGNASEDDRDGASDEVDSHVEPDEPPERGNRKKVELDVRVLLAILVVVALAAGAYVLGQRQGKELNQAVDRSTGTTVFKPPKEFVPLADPSTGVKLSVPRDWVQYSTRNLPDKAIRISVGIPNTGDTVVVRVNP